MYSTDHIPASPLWLTHFDAQYHLREAGLFLFEWAWLMPILITGLGIAGLLVTNRLDRSTFWRFAVPWLLFIGILCVLAELAYRHLRSLL